MGDRSILCKRYNVESILRHKDRCDKVVIIPGFNFRPRKPTLILRSTVRLHSASGLSH